MCSMRIAVLLLTLLDAAILTSASVVIIAPGKIRFATEQKIIILGSDLSDNDRTFLITIHPKNNPSHTFYRQTRTIQNDVLAEITINIHPSDLIPVTSESITLRVQSTRDGGIDKRVNIGIDKSPGHILIQIDKPLYTSRQKVKYRIIAVDESLRFAPWQVQISLMNPRGHLIDRVTKDAPDAFNGDYFQLSRNPMKGEWKVRASYTSFSTDTTVTFEVKDYILPRFRLDISCNSSSVVVSNSSPIKVSVKAEYVYGEPVRGKLSVSVFARIGNEDHYIFEGLEYRLSPLGEADIIFNDEEIKDHNAMYYYPVQLYIAINATEESSGNVLRKVFKMSMFAEYPYQLSIVNEKTHYQPGLSYKLELEALKPDGRPAKNVPIVFLINGEETTLTTNGKGRVLKEVVTPVSQTYFLIKFRPAGLFPDWENLRLYPVLSAGNHAIKIDAQQYPDLGRPLEVSVTYRTPPGTYYIMVASRGHVVFLDSYTSGTNGEDVRTIPTHVLPDMIPMARLIVFYMVGDLVVADSSIVEMKKVCREELSMEAVGNRAVYKPKDTGQIRINGGPNMQVGLLAVDRGVYALKFEKSLTRQKVFDELLSHDMGDGAGDGDDPVEIFRNAGFTLIPGFDGAVSIVGGDLHSSSQSFDAGPPRGDNPLLRSFFPESWLFQEETLNDEGSATIDVTYPDSITAWIMVAVGVSPNQGICVSKVEKVEVFQKFFVDLDIPFRAVKLEEVKAKVTVSNYLGYDTEVHLSASADGVCILGCDGDNITFEIAIPNGERVTRTVDVLPTKPGNYVIRARAKNNRGLEVDEIEKQLLVVSEGEPKVKSITFNLDPNGEDRYDMSIQQEKQGNIQDTLVNLAFPKEAIPQSEKIEIIASGDLLGDVINNFVLNSKLPSDLDGSEGLMKELAPSCYGLHYLATLDALSPEVLQKGREHIRHGLSELMKYRTDEGGFCLEEVDNDFENHPSIWFTAMTLKTLCTAKSVLNMDEELFTRGYEWLLDQVTVSRWRYTVNEIEENERMIHEEGLHLESEILLSSISCSHHMDAYTHRFRRNFIRSYARNQYRMRRKWRRHQGHLLMAKVAYTNIVLGNDRWLAIAQRLIVVKNEFNGYVFWSNEPQQDNVPSVYLTKPTAEAIEATSYALMVFVHVKNKYNCRRQTSRGPCRLFIDTDKIAEWLLQWRNADGLFMWASDTAVATEALAMYRNSKRIQSIDLNVDVSTSPNRTFTHTLEFGEDDAFLPQSLQDVPLGQSLHVQTQGSGIGQMHVDTIYNTPIDVNEDCHFQFNIERYVQNFQSIQAGNTGLCPVCGTDMYCPRESFECHRDATTCGGTPIYTYCLKVCVKSNSEYNHGRLDIRIRMLSGYVPHECDLEAQQKLQGGSVSKASYDDEENLVKLQLKRVSSEEMECYGFRIFKMKQVLRMKPGIATLKSYNVDDWTCPREYTGGDEAVSRPVYCTIAEENQYRGCTCIADSCVQCGPPPGETLGTRFYRRKAGDALYVFYVRAVRSEVQLNTGARHLIFEVLEELKNCLSDCFVGSQVTFVTKVECECPIFDTGMHYWLTGRDYNTYVDINGHTEHRFFLNKEVFLLSSVNPEQFERESSVIRRARSRYNTCPEQNIRRNC